MEKQNALFSASVQVVVEKLAIFHGHAVFDDELELLYGLFTRLNAIRSSLSRGEFTNIDVFVDVRVHLVYVVFPLMFVVDHLWFLSV